MEIRSTTEQDLDVFVDTLHAAFGRFPDTLAGGGPWWGRSKWTATCSP
ncbi:hypothetical protein DWB77_07057 [Streptomyces hundungensis]|uniref:Uncharacterized protein n=1 Tax=Streptomyces hundungensis TaxID=1077946 RepID=A0A387HS75_9ACTN|nr:hypothetical protein DWB77_07057 [Streptomyces hundungensis]